MQPLTVGKPTQLLCLFGAEPLSQLLALLLQAKKNVNGLIKKKQNNVKCYNVSGEYS